MTQLWTNQLPIKHLCGFLHGFFVVSEWVSVCEGRNIRSCIISASIANVLKKISSCHRALCEYVNCYLCTNNGNSALAEHNRDFNQLSFCVLKIHSFSFYCRINLSPWDRVWATWITIIIKCRFGWAVVFRGKMVFGSFFGQTFAINRSLIIAIIANTTLNCIKY